MTGTIKKYCIVLLLLICVERVHAQNENISEGLLFDGEPYLAIDPMNAQHIVVCWMSASGTELIKIKVRTSFNGGITWSSPVSIPHNASGYTSADPSMDYDSYGNVYLCFVDYNLNMTGGGDYLIKSTNDGLTWAPAKKILDAFDDALKYPIDRPWMTIDKSGGINDGNIYITSKPAPWVSAPNRNYFVTSTDGGETFNAWRYIDTAGWSIGDFIQAPMAAPAIAADGIFYCVYPGFKISESIYPRFIMAASNNAGIYFNYNLVLNYTGGLTDTLPKFGYRLTADKSDANHLAFVYFAAPYGDADIFSTETFNKGTTWSTPVRINSDMPGNGKLQDLVWADFNQYGDFLITWRDRRNAPDTGYITSSEIWGAVKWKDSVSFSSDFKIADTLVAYNEVLSGNGNDFMSSQLFGDTLYAVWGDTRNGTLNIWFQKMNARNGSVTGIQNIASENSKNILIYPNPASNKIFISAGQINEIIIYDLMGKLIMHQSIYANNFEINIQSLPAAEYIIELKSFSDVFYRKFTKQ